MSAVHSNQDLHVVKCRAVVYKRNFIKDFTQYTYHSSVCSFSVAQFCELFCCLKYNVCSSPLKQGVLSSSVVVPKFYITHSPEIKRHIM